MMTDIVDDVNSFISHHNASGTGKEHEPKSPPTISPSYYAPSLMLLDGDTNSSPAPSITSNSTYMSSCFVRPTSQPSTPYTEPSHMALQQSGPYAAPRQLICEFRGFAKCDQVFHHSDEPRWVTHIAREHLRYMFPATCVCWFCDREFKASSQSQADTETCYRKRMHHIAKHFRNGVSRHRMRPDFFFLDHVYNSGLINEEQFQIYIKDNTETSNLHLDALGPDQYQRSRRPRGKPPRGRPKRFLSLKDEKGKEGTRSDPNNTDISVKDCKPGPYTDTEWWPPKSGLITRTSNDSPSLNDSCGNKLPSNDTICSSMAKLEANLSEGSAGSSTMRSSPNYSRQHTPPILPKLPEDLESSASSQTPESDGSSFVTETYIDERKRQIVNSIVSNVTQWLRSAFNLCRKNAGGDSSGVSGTSEESQRSSSKGELSNRITPGKQKRKLTQINDGETDDDNEEENKESRKGGKEPLQNHNSRKYACPYFKYNPAKYKEWRICPGPGWADIHRVKEHLYRRHKQPKYRCGRCWHPFKDEQCYMDHLRTEEACPLREMEHVEGFDAAQEQSLRSRKRPDRDLSEDDKWRRVFKILFPHILDDDIPSPFYEYNPACQREDNRQQSDSSYLAQCEDYMVREVPQRLRQALARELDRDLTIVEESLRRKAGDWVKTLLEEAFKELRKNRGSEGQSQPSEEAGLPIERSGIPAPQAGSSRNDDLPYEEESQTWLSNFSLDSLDPFMLLGETEFAFDNGGLLEDLLRPGDDNDGDSRKFSDSGYESHRSIQFDR